MIPGVSPPIVSVALDRPKSRAMIDSNRRMRVPDSTGRCSYQRSNTRMSQSAYAIGRSWCGGGVVQLPCGSSRSTCGGGKGGSPPYNPPGAVVFDVDRPQQPAVDRRVLRLHEPGDPGGDAVVGAAAAGVAAVPVGRRGAAVDAHPDADPVLVEELEEPVVDQDAVGLDGE